MKEGDAITHFDNSLLNPELEGNPKYCFRIRVIGNNTELSTQHVENTVNNALRLACEEDKLPASVSEKLEPVYTLLVLNRLRRTSKRDWQLSRFVESCRLFAKVSSIYALKQVKPKMRVSPALFVLDVFDASKVFSASELIAFSSPTGLVVPGSEIAGLASYVLQRLENPDDVRFKRRDEILVRVCAEALIATRKPKQEGVTAKEAVALGKKIAAHRTRRLKMERLQKNLREAQRTLAKLSRDSRNDLKQDMKDFYTKGTRKR
jgi:hypothetical protein